MKSLYDHGTASKYRQGCRAGQDGKACEPCRGAYNRSMRGYRNHGTRTGTQQQMDVSDAIDLIAEMLHANGRPAHPSVTGSRAMRRRP